MGACVYSKWPQKSDIMCGLSPESSTDLSNQVGLSWNACVLCIVVNHMNFRRICKDRNTYYVKAALFNSFSMNPSTFFYIWII